MKEVTPYKNEFRILVGTVDGAGWGYERPVKLYARPRLEVIDGTKTTVDHEPIENPMRFAIVGDYYSPGGLDIGGGTLGADDLAVVTDRAAPDKVFAALAALADWHLNDLKAACAHQTVEYEAGRYGQRQPSLDGTLPCPVTGYRFGTSWLVKPLTVDMLELARSIGCVVPAGGTVINDGGVETTKGGCVS